MESRFIFLEDDCPKLAEYGRKAEEFSPSDPNMSLLFLGRIAELITEELCRRSNIHDTQKKLDALISRGVITEDIARKILALTDAKNDAVNSGYDSETASERLIVAAEELCRWFITEKLESRFSFLADIFPPDKPVPILMNLSELGREAEENLFVNTRYCLICLGDMGEAVADRLISDSGIETHERDQIDRIDVLADNSVITKEVSNILHDLRMARNKALHERYNDEYTSESEGRRLIDDALTLCEWLFRKIMKPGYAVKARITGKTDAGYSAAIGRIAANVPDNEIPDGKICGAGKKYIFKISGVDGEIVTLSMKDADNDSGLSMAKLYARYKPGQDVHVTIKSLSNSTGAIVELKDGLEARIPPSELGRKIYRYDHDTREKLVRYETTARVKWFSLTQYPPMLLSVKDVEESEGEETPGTQSAQETKQPMSDWDFRLFCKDAAYEKIIQALDEGANPNSTNGNNTTALMMAAQFNKNHRVTKALIEAGARVNEQNHRGNTALMYAAMSNNSEVVRAILEADADISLVNNEGKKAVDYAKGNRKINDKEDIMSRLRDEPETVTEIAVVPESETITEIETVIEPETVPDIEPVQEPGTLTEPEHIPDSVSSLAPDPLPLSPNPLPQTANPETEPEESLTYYEYELDEQESIPTKEEEEAMREKRKELQRNFLRICRSGTEDEIAEAVSAGVNVNVTNKSSATALMFAAKSNTAQAAEILIHAGAAINAQDDGGNTALIYAASFNTDDVVETLIDAGADTGIANLAGHTARDYAAKNYRLIDTEAINRL